MFEACVGVQCCYDAFGEEVEQAVTPAGGSTTDTKFAYDGWNPNMPAGTGNANFMQWAVLNGDDSLQSRNINGNAPGQHLARVDQSGASDPSGVYYILSDRLNSVRDVVDSTGTVQDAISYDAYGNILSGGTDASYRGWYAYTGQEFDVQTDLQYNNARWYDATTGRWISQDPMGFDAGDSNLYRYVNNAPTDATDSASASLTMPTATRRWSPTPSATRRQRTWLPPLVNWPTVAVQPITQILPRTSDRPR